MSICLCLASAGWGAETNGAIAKANAALGRQLIQLLETQDAEAFANQFSPSLADLEGVAEPGTNPATIKETATKKRAQALRISRELLDVASRLGLTAERVRFQVKAEGAPRVHLSNDVPYGKEIYVPFTSGLRVVLLGEPVTDTKADAKFRGEYELMIYWPRLFPAGWRVGGGVWWNRVPDGLADPLLEWELAFIPTAPTNKPPITITNDPALLALGNTLIRVIKQRDVQVFASGALLSFDEAWNYLLKEVPADELPPKAEVRTLWEKKREELLLNPVRTLVAQMDRLGIDLSRADVTLKEAAARTGHLSPIVQYGSLDGMQANPLTFKFAVKSDALSKAGKPIAGEYSVLVGRAERKGRRWIVWEAIAWDKFPNGLVGPKELAEMEFEKYVVEHGKLPPGTVAPDIQFTRLDTGARVSLAAFRGKVVVLEYWATSCGPCQDPMAQLQTVFARHPEWKGRVEVITVSLDENPDVVRAHLAKRGWNQTLNGWAGAGEFLSPAAKAFRVESMPTTYVIDPAGKTVDVKRLRPEVTKDAKGNVIDAKLRIVDELEAAVVPLVDAARLR
ncbi:MAG: TlpA disulfide reductase family protein [Verrucomicrobiota bacterium]